MNEETLKRHAYALQVSGFTIAEKQFDAEQLKAIQAASDRALRAVNAAVEQGRKLPLGTQTDHYRAVRCLYCWDEACLTMLEHELVHGIGGMLMGTCRLWDLSLMVALPTPEDIPAATTSWHQDFPPATDPARRPEYLWCFLCLDDVTANNGATWVVPGSHLPCDSPPPTLQGTWQGDDLGLFPSRIQAQARAGDMIILNPAALHTSGRNSTHRPRRMINMGICRADVAPLLDHTAVAGSALRGHSQRLRAFMSTTQPGLPRTWPVLPPGWKTADNQEGGD